MGLFFSLDFVLNLSFRRYVLRRRLLCSFLFIKESGIFIWWIITVVVVVVLWSFVCILRCRQEAKMFIIGAATRTSSNQARLHSRLVSNERSLSTRLSINHNGLLGLGRLALKSGWLPGHTRQNRIIAHCRVVAWACVRVVIWASHHLLLNRRCIHIAVLALGLPALIWWLVRVGALWDGHVLVLVVEAAKRIELTCV